jgi:thiopeptide-type bacteriocin biosynthesis protein
MRTPLYHHRGAALLRAAAAPLSASPQNWPDLGNIEASRAWLASVWARPEIADAISHASPGLASRVEAVLGECTAPHKQVRRATVATVRYLLRATGRHTPFGLFAGVAPVTVGPATAAPRWGSEHRAAARADTQWVADVIDQLEASADLLERLDVVFTNLATVRGERLEAPQGPNRVSARNTGAVHAVRVVAASPVRFADLATTLANTFPNAGPATIRAMLTSLVRQGFLITSLRAPCTVTDPLAYLITRLQAADAATVASVATTLKELEGISADVRRHNQPNAGRAEQRHLRADLTERMRALSSAGRTPLALDLRLDADVVLPEAVAREMEWAATALVRLTRQPTGHAHWRDFYVAFCERYGTGTLVPLADVVDPDAGLGLPAGYPGSVLPAPHPSVSERDETLLALAFTALADGSGEILLTDDMIRALTVGDPDAQRHLPPHVELAGRVQATSVDALQRGDYTVTVAPGRSAGTFTSRFTTIAPDSGLEQVIAALPTAIDGALPVQLSFPPVYPNGENVCRVPAYLPHVLALGEHRDDQPRAERTVINLDELGVTATRSGLHLVSLSRGRALEPQVVHALALEKQPPPLARFLAHLSRALGATWHQFDWGQAAQRLPFLPRVRYRRAILSPACWRLNVPDLPAHGPDHHVWIAALARWAKRWQCPSTVELRDADRSLPLKLAEPAHQAILHAHLARHGHAVLAETPDPTAFGWAGGHVHEIALPLFTTRPPSPSPRITGRPTVTNSRHGQLPGSAETTWLNAALHTHPERIDEIITDRLPVLLNGLDPAPECWFVRYRSPHEIDHLRLRLRTPDRAYYARALAALGDWAAQLRQDGAAGLLTVGTYLPETGRYGHGAAMDAAETVFVADSGVVAAQLRHLPATVIEPAAMVALGMVDTVAGFLGTRAAAMDWLRARPAPDAACADRAVLNQVVDLTRTDGLDEVAGWADHVAGRWRTRAAALGAYRERLGTDVDADAVLESLLHMHHNRAAGIDRDGENTCRRLARHAALAWQAQLHGTRR